MITQQRLREVLDYDPETGAFRWRVRKSQMAAGSLAGSIRQDGYWCVCVDGRIYLAHQLAWLFVYGAWPAQRLDHRDRIKTNNRIANLREATRSQNGINGGVFRNNKSGVRGVYYHPSKRGWMAQLRVNHRNTTIGRFSTKAEAAQAYLNRVAEVFGEYTPRTGEQSHG